MPCHQACTWSNAMIRNAQARVATTNHPCQSRSILADIFNWYGDWTAVGNQYFSNTRSASFSFLQLPSPLLVGSQLPTPKVPIFGDDSSAKRNLGDATSGVGGGSADGIRVDPAQGRRAGTRFQALSSLSRSWIRKPSKPYRKKEQEINQIQKLKAWLKAPPSSEAHQPI